MAEGRDPGVVVSRAFLVAARRTPIAPKGGPLSRYAAHELAAATMAAVLDDGMIEPGAVDEVIFGNALYGGGNPARLAALAAGLPETTPATTLDTQCCAGLDAVLSAVSRVRAGEAGLVIAGGVESYSRAPQRIAPPESAGAEAMPYSRPPFTPWPDRDPDMIEAAAGLAERLNITREAQEVHAVGSHAKAQAAAPPAEIVPLGGLARDPFTRNLTLSLCRRLPGLAGGAACGVTAATVAVEADGAAAVIVALETVARHLGMRGIEVVGGARAGYDPAEPGLALVPAVRTALGRSGLDPASLDHAEVMEAFSAQAMAGVAALGLDPEKVNQGGGALARGHPIGASGAVLVVRLFHELAKAQTEGRRSGFGLAAIAAAGGLGSAVLLRGSEARD